MATEQLASATDSTTTNNNDNNNNEQQQESKSALQDNLERKGQNAYYFAHAHKATGPAWDGKVEPKLLARHLSTDGHRVSQNSSFDYTKSNITTYSFLDYGAKVKLYLDMANVGEKCSDDDVTLDYTERSLSFAIRNYKLEGDPQILSFGKLNADISAAKFCVKKDKVIITLTKVDANKEWDAINDKGKPSC